MLNRFVLTVAATLLASGCLTSRITPSHQPHATMMSGAGELRGSARVGPSLEHDLTARARVAYSPVDALVVAGAADLDFMGEDEHYGGEVAVGAYLPGEDYLRLEGLAGLGGGYTEGYGEYFVADGSGSVARTDLSGAYVQPFLQGSIGFAVPYFEAAAGTRFAYTHVAFDLAQPPADGPDRGRSDWLTIQPFLQLAVPIEYVRLETALGMDMTVAGESSEFLGLEAPLDFWIVFGVGFQLDTTTGEPPRTTWSRVGG